MKTAIVTGGSRGIGAAIVEKLSKDGYRVVFNYYKSHDAAMELSQKTGALSFQANLLSQKETESFCAYAVKQLGTLDALVLNAGISRTGLFCSLDEEAHENLFRINYHAPAQILRLCLPFLREQQGKVVAISSVWGLSPACCEAAYSASKAALQTLITAVSKEEGNLNLNCICPGAIKTDMLNEYTTEEIQDLISRTPKGRLGKPKDVVEAAAFLLSDKADFITGQTLVVDGGFLGS
jgi:3-oxoacyl-[acyl-carrier protein] reductase